MKRKKLDLCSVLGEDYYLSQFFSFFFGLPNSR